MKYYLGSSPSIFKGLAEAHAESEAKYEHIRQPSIFASPVRQPRVPPSPYKPKTLAPEERIPTTVRIYMQYYATVDEDDLLTVDRDFPLKQAMKSAKEVLEWANLNRMMRPSPQTELERKKALDIYRKTKKAVDARRSNGKYYI